METNCSSFNKNESRGYNDWRFFGPIPYSTKSNRLQQFTTKILDELDYSKIIYQSKY